MVAERLGSGVNGMADVTGDDGGTVEGGDIGEPASAASSVEDQPPTQPAGCPPRIGEEPPFR